MAEYRIGVIRVMTLEDPEMINLHGKLLEEYFPEFKTSSLCIPDQPEGITGDESFRIAVPKVVKLAKEHFADMDGIIVSCASDPGLADIRRELPGMPVAGAASSVIGVANFYGKKLGVMGNFDGCPDPYIPYESDVVDSRAPEGIKTGLDFLKPEGKASVLRRAGEMKAAGADVIALACTGLSAIKAADIIEEEVGIPTIDPLRAAGLMIYYELMKKRTK